MFNSFQTGYIMSFLHGFDKITNIIVGYKNIIFTFVIAMKKIFSNITSLEAVNVVRRRQSFVNA